MFEDLGTIFDKVYFNAEKSLLVSLLDCEGVVKSGENQCDHEGGLAV